MLLSFVRAAAGRSSAVQVVAAIGDGVLDAGRLRGRRKLVAEAPDALTPR